MYGSVYEYHKDRYYDLPHLPEISSKAHEENANNYAVRVMNKYGDEEPFF